MPACLLAAAAPGDVTWQAAPFNLQWELLPAPGRATVVPGAPARNSYLGADLSAMLDDIAGVPRKTVASLARVVGTL